MSFGRLNILYGIAGIQELQGGQVTKQNQQEVLEGAPVGHVSYIFLDESGNFDFSTNGTRHLVLTGISMRRPFGVFGRLDNYKYDCIETGTDIECFHCHEDRWEVRRTIFDLIAAHLYDMSIDCLIVEKRKTRPEMQDSEKLYKWMLGHFLTRIVSHELNVGNSNAIVITDTIPLNKKRKAVEKAIHKAVNKNQLPGIRYRILHHQSRSHYGLQVVDYCCWAIFRKWQRGETSWYDRIQPALRSELDVFETETKCYY